MDAKPRPNHRRYIEILRGMTAEKRLAKAFELTKFARELFIQGLRERHPDVSDEEIRRMVLERLRRSHKKS